MLAVLKREVKNYIKQPLFWVGLLVVIFGVFQAVSPYMTTHYLSDGEEIVNDFPDEVHAGEVYEGYVPSTKEERREIWERKMKESLIAEFKMSAEQAQAVIEEMKDMDINEACQVFEEKYHYYGAIYMYQASAYHKGSAQELNSYIREKLEDKPFSYYFARKFADFAGLYMGFFATIMLSVLFMQDMRKNTYELLHTKPIGAGSYVAGKAGGGFAVCLIALGVLNLVFWLLCRIYTKSSGFSVRLIDFLAASILYILPNMLMIVCVYELISLIFKNPLPAVPLLVLYITYSNMGGRNSEGIYGYYGRLFAIMVRFQGQLFDTELPPMALQNQVFLLVASVGILLISAQIWKRRPA